MLCESLRLVASEAIYKSWVAIDGTQLNIMRVGQAAVEVRVEDLLDDEALIYLMHFN